MVKKGVSRAVRWLAYYCIMLVMLGVAYVFSKPGTFTQGDVIFYALVLCVLFVGSVIILTTVARHSEPLQEPPRQGDARSNEEALRAIAEEGFQRSERKRAGKR